MMIKLCLLTILFLDIGPAAATAVHLFGGPVSKRAAKKEGPLLPAAQGTPSYWLDNPPFKDLTSIQSKLPDEADVVIIGSGITGAAAARTILQLSAKEKRRPRVVVLEARELCSGATGRNGGHIKSMPYLTFSKLKNALGRERAGEIVRFQMRHLPAMVELGREHPLGQVRTVETADVFLEKEDLNLAKKQVEEVKKWLPNLSLEVFEGDIARKKYGVNDYVAGVISHEAGAAWPYRLVASVWKKLLDEPGTGLSMHTDTAVLHVENVNISSAHPYQVQTSRGDLRARHVLHATNGFASQLVPALADSLTGVLGHMTAQRPGARLPSFNGNRSWSIVYAPGFDYITQQPNDPNGNPGDLMVGGGATRSRLHGNDLVGILDDSQMQALPLMHLRGSMATVMEPNWGIGGGLKKAWSGILAITGDSLPFVGSLSALEGLEASVAAGLEGSGHWISAGYNGDGMVWAWLCGTAAGVMILGRENEKLEPATGRPGGKLADWFPVAELAIDKKRLARSKLVEKSWHVNLAEG